MPRSALPRRCSVASLLMVLVAALLAVTGCGAPTGSPATSISQVPPNLLAPAPTPTAVPTTPAERGPFIYLLDRQDRLVPVETGVVSSQPAEAAVEVLTLLAGGPGDSGRFTGLSTALGPDVSLTLIDLVDRRAVVEVRTGSGAPAAERLPLAVGQIVLSATSIPDIESVTLTNNGTPVDAPLPGGVLTSRPLTAADYAVLARQP